MSCLALTTVGASVASAADANERSLTTTGDQPPTEGYHGKRDDRGKGTDDRKGQKEKEPEGVPVPCDADSLIAAITFANARGGAVLDLAKNCTYLLTANIDGNGLPAITAPITLNGSKHTIIERAAAVEQFRIIAVDPGGDLTLQKLTITGGQTTNAGTDGAGIFVNVGGALTTNHSTVTRNIAGGSGGGIANNGNTQLNNSTVNRNTSNSSGGGVSSIGVLGISKSHIDFNNASLGGGIVSSGTSQIEGSSISGNRVQGAIGGYFINSGTSLIANSEVTNNVAAGSIGGIFVNVSTQVTLQSVTLAGNVASSGLAGGLGTDANSSVVIEDSVVKNNNSSNQGGAIFNSAGMVLRGTKVTGNQANLGGGIYNGGGGTLTLFATAVVENIAITDGGGIFNAGGTVELNTATGTVVVKNRPNNCSGAVPGCPG
ncbi:right-handed parallel beta-helix repeat-containing protein [Salinispora sp. H7-4]|uniref:right-handed parallel beta-helix repeat-containing protein n=1 Tax=Salinispora sp. H7-4 TaxID=2748321 RepID=UPI0035CB2FB8